MADQQGRVVVFGGAGFLGSHVADALSNAGHQVVVYDLVPSPYLRDDQEGVVGDILDATAVDEVVRGADVVYNYAGIADIEEASRDPLQAVEANILGNTVLLEAARKAEISRFVFASTVYVYSDAGSFYRCTKQSNELIIENYERAYGLPFTILRYGSLYGPRAGETNWIYRMLREAVLTGHVHRYGDGEEIREFIHAWDAANSSARILTPEFVNKHVIISGHQPIRIRDLLEMVREILGNRLEIEYLPASDNPHDMQPSLHYQISPYSFHPRIAVKLTRSANVDLGQGLLDLMGDVYRTERNLSEDAGVLISDQVDSSINSSG